MLNDNWIDVGEFLHPVDLCALALTNHAVRGALLFGDVTRTVLVNPARAVRDIVFNPHTHHVEDIGPHRRRVAKGHGGGNVIALPAFPAIFTSSFTFYLEFQVQPSTERRILMADWTSYWSWMIMLNPLGDGLSVALRRNIYPGAGNCGSNPDQDFRWKVVTEPTNSVRSTGNRQSCAVVWNRETKRLTTYLDNEVSQVLEADNPDGDIDLQRNDHTIVHIGWKQDGHEMLAGNDAVLRARVFLSALPHGDLCAMHERPHLKWFHVAQSPSA